MSHEMPNFLTRSSARACLTNSLACRTRYWVRELFTWEHQVPLWAKALQQICKRVRGETWPVDYVPSQASGIFDWDFSTGNKGGIIQKRYYLKIPGRNCVASSGVLWVSASWWAETLLRQFFAAENCSNWCVTASFFCAAAAPWCEGEVMVEIHNSLAALGTLFLMLALDWRW